MFLTRELQAQELKWKEYSLGVKVKATNDEMPAGLEKVLGLLAQ
ncbi:hypothetical protein ACFOEQ_20795 [Chryseobacterium arachidis]